MGTLTRVLGSASRHSPPPPPPRNTRRYVKVLTTLNGVVLSADRRGHQGFSNAYWKRAPPAEAHIGTSDFFIEIRPGFQFVITDMHNKSACLPGTSIYESPVSRYNLGFEGGYPTPPPRSPPPPSPSSPPPSPSPPPPS
eukprot:scaffold74852_cov57-Phaeocystis_antarctica.AAC.1